MHLATGLAILVAVATLVAVTARRCGLSEPLVLTVVGIIGSYLPFIPDVTITSDLVLVGLLPPLLYTSAIRASLVDFRANRRAIGLLSVGLVIFTAFGVGWVAWILLPIPFAAGVAIGAVVAPPDAVAATAVARRVGMPRRIITILEGESLLNDATALVTLQTAIAAIAGTFSVWQVGADFLWAALGGALFGLVTAFVLGKLRRLVTDPVLDTTLSFLAPFVAYLPAEELHASGVLAVVVTGLVLGQKAPVLQSASSRVAERTNWRTIEFVLENSVFLLIGLQLRHIADEAFNSDLGHGTVVGACIAILVAVIALRFIWVFPATYLPRLIPKIRANESKPPRTNLVVVSWAGMRGVVTLAAALVLRDRVPYGNVLVLAAFVVTAGTLLIQGTTLPRLVRLLRLRGPSIAEDALQQANVLQLATNAGLRLLDNSDEQLSEDMIAALRRRSTERVNAAWERLGPAESELETPSATYRRMRIAMLQAERSEVLRVRDRGVFDHEVLASVMALLDLEESMIDHLDDIDDEEEQELLPSFVQHVCKHLRDAPTTARPDTPGSCSECVAENLTWVHLRMCLTCGHVACCDSSPGQHAERHFDHTQHPVMRSVEPGEAWRWCYIDSKLG